MAEPEAAWAEEAREWVAEMQRLRAVRDQLLAGLHEIKSQMHNLPRSATADYVERTASDLIAKAKEQP